jgi:hypothetical protein
MSAMETAGIQKQPEAGLPTRVVIYMAKALQNMMAFIWENHFKHMAFIWHPFFHVKNKIKHIYSSDSCQNLLRIGTNHFGKKIVIF